MRDLVPIGVPLVVEVITNAVVSLGMFFVVTCATEGSCEPLILIPTRTFCVAASSLAAVVAPPSVALAAAAVVKDAVEVDNDPLLAPTFSVRDLQKNMMRLELLEASTR
jgi:hypothetical protein